MTRVRYTRPAFKIKEVSLHLHTTSTLGNTWKNCRLNESNETSKMWRRCDQRVPEIANRNLDQISYR